MGAYLAKTKAIFDRLEGKLAVSRDKFRWQNAISNKDLYKDSE